jgi:hypothetical protein
MIIGDFLLGVMTTLALEFLIIVLIAIFGGNIR